MPSGGWLVSPLFDLFFIANLGWLLLLWPTFSADGSTVVDFWQVYYVTLPHRWITLILVLLDPDRRTGQTLRLGVVAILALALVGGVYTFTGGLTCLALLDFVWNAWHFGSQHAGVARMYSLKAGAPRSQAERWGIRILVTYTLWRTAGWATGWTSELSWIEPTVTMLDGVVLLMPLMVIAVVLHQGAWTWGRISYLTSVLTLYIGLLISTANEWSRFIVPLIAAAALFHAAEYLAIVTLYARRRESVGSAGRFRQLATHWPIFLVLYIVTLGSIGIILESGSFSPVWVAVNTWIALVHYSFDGMIWKLRTPATATALGATPSPPY